MTTQEVRTLLERVEAHGGPIKVWKAVGGLRLRGEWGGAWFDDVLTERNTSDHLVGVLKRDLIERGCGVNMSYSPPRHDEADTYPWTAFVLAYDKRNTARLEPEYGHSELEAVLRAWLAAAEAEGWTA